MHPAAEALVRIEASKARIQAQRLEDKLKLVAPWRLDDGAARTLVDDAAKIIATFTNIIACLSSSSSSSLPSSALALDPHDLAPMAAAAAAAGTTSDASRSDDDHGQSKKRKVKHQHQQHGSEPEMPDDGYTWRKYGQKDILGSLHPKSYYRCTHKRESGCPAIKYVQRSDANPSSFRITYRGEHTCSSGHGLARKSPVSIASSPPASPLLNSVCLRINSDGGLQLGALGPTVIPSLPQLAPISVPQDQVASVPIVVEQRERAEVIHQSQEGAIVASSMEDDACGGISIESMMLELGPSVLESFDRNYKLFPSDHSSPEWSDCIAY